MAEIYKAKIDHYLSNDAEAWTAYEHVIERIVREFGEGLQRRNSWVKASDGSVTPSREQLADAVAVLEAEGLDFTYSFTSLASESGDDVSIFVWTDRRWVMVTSRTNSASRSKGFVTLAKDFLEANYPSRISRVEREDVGSETGSDAEPELLPERKGGTPRWALITLVGAIITAIVGVGAAILTESIKLWLWP